MHLKSLLSKVLVMLLVLQRIVICRKRWSNVMSGLKCRHFKISKTEHAGLQWKVFQRSNTEIEFLNIVDRKKVFKLDHIQRANKYFIPKLILH